MSEEEEIIIITKPPKKLAGVTLVPGAENWTRWWSMRWIIAAAIAEALPLVWARLPADWIDPMPASVKVGLGAFTGVALVAAAVSRVIQQTPKPGG